MGDILHSMPAVTALRQAHPEWVIGWAIEPQWRGLFIANDSKPGTPGMPLVDHLHIVPAKKWARSPLHFSTVREMRNVRREIRAMQYDVVAEMQGAVRAAMVARWAQTGRIIGEAQPREFAAKWFFNEKVATRGVHVIEQSLEVANAICSKRICR